MNPKPHPRRSRKAMAVAMVIVLTTALLIISAGLLAIVTQENRLTRRAAAVAELKQASDTILGYGASQVITNKNVTTLRLPPTDLFQADSDKLTRNSIAEREIIMSADTALPTASSPTTFYIDPAAPFNANDKLKGQLVFRNLRLLASRAAVRAPGAGDLVEEYAMMVLERRSMHVFNYLAFFDVAQFRISNPGSDVLLDGPIQANAGISFQASNQTSVVTIASKLHTPGSFTFSGSTTAGKFRITDGTLKSNGTLNYVDMLKPSSSVLRQTSDGSSFKDFMINTTNRYLATGETGENTVDLEGLNFVDDSASAISDTYKLVNNRRIDPPNPTVRNSTEAEYAAVRAAESVKTAYQAGLYTYVEQNGVMTVFTSQTAAAEYKESSNKSAWKSNAANQTKFLAADEASAFVTMPYIERYNGDTTNYLSSTKNTDLARSAIFDSQQKKTVAMVDVNLGSLKTKIDSGSLKLANGSTVATTGTGGWNGILYVDVQNPNSRPAALVKDKATGQYVSTTGQLTNDSSSAISKTLPSLNITGKAVAWDTGNAVDDSAGLTAVRIKNAATVPEAKVGSTGFTLATNTATYTVGSVNADGNLATGTTSLQDDQSSSSTSSSKVPMAIFSDKNIVLSADFANLDYDLKLYVAKPSTMPAGMSSGNWPFTGPSSTTLKGSKGNGQYQYQAAPSSGSVMELNCGFIIGDDDATNKGIHTMLSYLQPFSTTNDTLRMRGALIGVFKSRFFTAAAGSFNDYYIAPVRTFGYSSLFKDGKMPPGAPMVTNHRRVRQFLITKADYAALKARAGQAADEWLTALGDKY